MTHQSGISISSQLDQVFGESRSSGDIRWVKARIEDESIVFVKSSKVVDSLEKDFQSISGELQPKTPCYIMMRTDAQANNSYQWILLSYVPDGSTVRDRMLYASSRDTLKRQLGLSYFSDDIHGTTPDEFTWAAYSDHINKKTFSDAPLTQSEIQHIAEKTAAIDLGHTREYVHSVRFPMSNVAVQKLTSLSDSMNYVQLKVDTAKETIELSEAKNVSASGLSSAVPSNEPSFIFTRFAHTFEGEQQNPIVFIYSCPESSPVKLKMLYSTVKAVAIESAEKNGVIVEKKLEVTETSELAEKAVIEALHPQSEVKKQGFTKPSRPGQSKPRTRPSGN